MNILPEKSQKNVLFQGNKGAVTIRMDVYGISLCLVNSHLAAHDGHLQERVASYNNIVDTQKFKHNPETTSIYFHEWVVKFISHLKKIVSNL